MRFAAKSRRFREDAADNAERPSRGGPAERNGRAPSGSRRRRPSNTPPRCACRGGTASLCRRSWALCPIPCTCSAPRPCCRPRPAPSERPRSARIERRSAGGGRIGENAVARLAGVWWREWPIRVGGNGCFYSGASNGVRIARDRVALMARGDEHAPPRHLALHGPRGRPPSMRAARASRRPWAAPLRPGCGDPSTRMGGKGQPVTIARPGETPTILRNPPARRNNSARIRTFP